MAALSSSPMTFEDIFHTDAKAAQNLFGETTFRRLQKALDDFNAVLAGSPPVHAKVDRDRPLPADGGTTFYIGDGYRLTIVKSLNGIMRGKEYIHGFTYGPIISFEPKVMSGNLPSIQQVTFYTGEELQKLFTKSK